jgi:hypothetical protein
MTGRGDRLTRLLAVRNVRLALAGRALASAAATAAATAATAARLGALRAEFRGQPGRVAGYAIKAASATRSALVAAEQSQGARLADAEARRSAVEGEFRNRRAGVDAVARAVDRAATIAGAAMEPT